MSWTRAFVMEYDFDSVPLAYAGIFWARGACKFYSSHSRWLKRYSLKRRMKRAQDRDEHNKKSFYFILAIFFWLFWRKNTPSKKKHYAQISLHKRINREMIRSKIYRNNLLTIRDSRVSRLKFVAEMRFIKEKNKTRSFIFYCYIFVVLMHVWTWSMEL